MARKTYIVDGIGSDVSAEVTSGGYLKTQPSPYPATDARDLAFVYRQFLTLNGDNTTSSMLVDGSVTSQRFYIEGLPEVDIYISTLSFIIQGEGIELGNDFAGNGAALANGCRLLYEDNNGEIIIADSLKTNFDFIRLCQGNPAFNDGDSSSGAGPFIAPGIAGGGGGKGGSPAADAIIPVLNIKDVFGLPFGIKLNRGTTHKLILEVNDDITAGAVGASAAFNIIAFGIKKIPD